MRLNHNLASLSIYNQLTKNEKAQSGAMNRVSTGVKVSSAADNPYALSQSEAQRMQIRGLQMAQRNLQDGVSMIQTVGSALESVTSMIQRIRELTVQAGGINSTEDKKIMQTEIDHMKASINDVVNNTEFNGVKLLNDSSVTSNNTPASLLMTVGANSNENVAIPKYNFTAGLLGMETPGNSVNDINVMGTGGIDQGLGILDSALNMVMNARSKYGALENRFDSMYNNVGETEATIQRAESGSIDTDIALEMIEISKNGVLMEAGNALLVQTNRFPIDILRVLENIRR